MVLVALRPARPGEADGTGLVALQATPRSRRCTWRNEFYLAASADRTFVSIFSAGVAKAGRPLPAASGSFLALDAPNLQMVTLKEAEDRDGWILRLRETAGRAGETELRLPTLRVKEAHLCNGVEVNRRRLATTDSSVRIPYTPNHYVTVRLKGESALGQRARR